jgi:3-methyladenine DNA glycosylase AlkD
MPTRKPRAAAPPAAKRARRVPRPGTRTEAPAEVPALLAELERLSSRRIREEMGPRYGVHAAKAFGVGIGDIQKLAKRLGRNHDLAQQLWDSGWYEARLLAAFVDEPERVTAAQMDRWARDFDNWGICDTVCFHLFDRTPFALKKVEQWAGRRGEFVKRAAFALLACVALHDKSAGDEPFLRCLTLIEAAAADERNFVKKGVSWALHAVGRRSPELRAAALALARRLAASAASAERWVGRDALRALAP